MKTIKKIQEKYPNAKVVTLTNATKYFQCSAIVEVEKITQSGKKFTTKEAIYENGKTKSEAISNFFNKYM